MDAFLTFIGRFHPLIVHLPIGFIVLGVLMEGNRKKFKFTDGVLQFVLFWIIVSGLFSLVTGYFQYTQEGHLWFGRIILEAQALGKIPIAFDHGGATETIIDGQNGFLAVPVKVESLAEKISFALSLKKNDRQKMAEYSKKVVSKNFSHDRMCKLTLSLYKQCIAEYKAAN